MRILILATEIADQNILFLEWLMNNLFIPLLLIIIPAIISFIVAKVQIKAAEKNINIQIDAEIKKIRLQHEYEQKRDNKNYLNKLLLENSFELKDRLANYCRSERQLANLIYHIVNEGKGTNKEIANKIEYESFKHGDEHPFDNAEVNSLMVFIPELEDKWRELSILATLITIIIPGEINNKLKNNLPYDIENFKIEIMRFERLSTELLEMVREYIRKTIIKLN